MARVSGQPAPDRLRAAEAVLRPVAGVEELQVVGAVPEAVVALLGLRTAARSVWLHPDAVAHIAAQRARAPGDAEFVLQHLAAAVLRPHWAALERDGRRVRLVHVVRAGSGYLFVALKCVTAAEAATGADEIWVSTAYRLGPRSLTRQLRAHSFIEVEASA